MLTFLEVPSAPVIESVCFLMGGIFVVSSEFVSEI